MKEKANTILTTINAFLYGILSTYPVDLKAARKRKIPMVFNIAILSVLLFSIFSICYTIFLDQRSK